MCLLSEIGIVVTRPDWMLLLQVDEYGRPNGPAMNIPSDNVKDEYRPMFEQFGNGQYFCAACASWFAIWPEAADHVGMFVCEDCGIADFKEWEFGGFCKTCARQQPKAF